MKCQIIYGIKDSINLFFTRVGNNFVQPSTNRETYMKAVRLTDRNEIELLIEFPKL